MMYMSNNIFSLINAKEKGFSKAFKLMSEYTKNNYLKMSFLSIQELSKEIGLSPATITRFSQNLGISGYSALQKGIREIVQNEIKPMREIRNSIMEPTKDKDILEKTIDLNIKNLEGTYSNSLKEAFKKAVDTVTSARKIYIIGLRSSYAVAYYLYFMLAEFMDNVIILSPGTQDMFDRISCISNLDVLVAISFPKYTKVTSQVVGHFKNSKSNIIVVTDSFSSPIAVRSDALLIAKNSSTTYSFVSAMTILNALIVAVAKKKGKKRALNKLKEKEKILVKNDIYI